MEKNSQKKAVSVTVALSLAACLSAAVYRRFGVASESESSAVDPKLQFNAQGFAGFHFQNTALIYDDARKWCVSHGMVLATADSPEKMEKIRQVSQSKNIWIGFRSFGAPNDKNAYRWESGAPHIPNGFSNWAPHEPNNVPQWPHEYCTEQLPNKLWNNLKCNDARWKRPFVCDRAPFIESYAMHGINGAGLTYDEADAQCRLRYGTSLASLTFADNMRTIIQSSQAPRAWVGLRLTPGKPWNANNYEFTSGVPRTVQVKWAPGQPQFAHEQCAEIRSDGTINDLACDARLKNYLCDQLVGNTLYHISSFEIMSASNPLRNRKIPSKIVEFQGRKNYRLAMEVRIWGHTPSFGNLLHLGSTNDVRSPAIWQHPAHVNRLHFRQQGLAYGRVWNNLGCDPMTMFHYWQRWFKVEVWATPNKFTVKYHGHVMCTTPVATVVPAARIPVWFSNPWTDAAKVSVKHALFHIF